MADRSLIIGNDDNDDDNYIGTNRTGTSAASTSSSVMRDYRKGNWTVTDTMVLIEAKKMDDERRTVKRSPVIATGSGKTSMEPRWKWVEDYCWRKGCYRSQNQCNDKWDNLMRDYKKVRDYERQRTGKGSGGGGGESSASLSSSYWNMEKTERKDRNLPTNMIPQIYDALVDVVERKVGGGSSAVATTTSQLLLPGIVTSPVTLQPATMLTPLPQPPKSYFPSPALVVAPGQPALPLPEGTESPPQPGFAASRPPQSTRDSEDTSQEHSDSPAKRRRTTGGGETGTSEARDMGMAITSGASVIAEAIQASNEREERRHRDMVSLHERRLTIEETKNEINREGINGLVDAINRLATSIHALASSSSSASASKNTNDNQPPP